MSEAVHSAWSSTFPPVGPVAVMVASLQTSPSRSGSSEGSPAPSREAVKLIAPSVSVPVLSVKSTWMLPRSSIVTSRLTSTLLRASWRDPAARLTLTIAGRSCGVIPIAIASENRSASMIGRERATLITKIETVRIPATQTSSFENSFSPT